MNPQIRELDEPATKNEANFVETALKLGGASEEEAKKTGALDRADEQVEDLFAKKYQTAGSPAHRAVWDKEFPIELFSGQSRPASAAADEVMRKSIEVVRRRQKDGTLMNEKKKITQETIDELAQGRLLGPVGRAEIRRIGRSVRSLCPVPGPHGHRRADDRRSRLGSRLHRRRRPIAYVRHSAAERRAPSQAGPRRTRLGVRSDGAVPPAPT